MRPPQIPHFSTDHRDFALPVLALLDAPSSSNPQHPAPRGHFQNIDPGRDIAPAHTDVADYDVDDTDFDGDDDSSDYCGDGDGSGWEPRGLARARDCVRGHEMAE